MESRQGFSSASGTVLRRSVRGEGDVFLTLFLRGEGLHRVYARGAAAGKLRFGGGTEPLVWGTFKLYKGRGGGLHLKSADVADDMLSLRARPQALFAAIRWAKLLMRHLMEEHPADDLLANLYWNMKLLESDALPVEAVEWRFLWRWLKSWGLAPDLTEVVKGSESDLTRLTAVAELKTSALTQYIARGGGFPEVKFLADANRRLEGFLNET